MAQPRPPSDDAAALRSVHTSNLPVLFDPLRISLVVSKDQAEKAIVVRNDNRTPILTTQQRAFKANGSEDE